MTLADLARHPGPGFWKQNIDCVCLILQQRKNTGGFRYFQKLSPTVKSSLIINLLGPQRKLR